MGAMKKLLFECEESGDHPLPAAGGGGGNDGGDDEKTAVKSKIRQWFILRSLRRLRQIVIQQMKEADKIHRRKNEMLDGFSSNHHFYIRGL